MDLILVMYECWRMELGFHLPKRAARVSTTNQLAMPDRDRLAARRGAARGGAPQPPGGLLARGCGAGLPLPPATKAPRAAEEPRRDTPDQPFDRRPLRRRYDDRGQRLGAHSPAHRPTIGRPIAAPHCFGHRTLST